MLQHHDDDGIGALGRHLEARGVELDVVSPPGPDPLPRHPDHDALVVLGGEMNVWQEDRHPWLAGEKALIRAWTDADRGPLLGICLGHQLLADALGGSVGPRARHEAGVHRVAATPAGRADALVGPLGDEWPTLQWHGAEVTEAPPGTVVLAANQACAIQAMRVGTRWWGVQFHPEVGPDGAEGWGHLPQYRRVLEDSDGPGAPDAFPAVLAAARPDMDAVTAALAEAFAAAIG